MPLYDWKCEKCEGVTTIMRPIAEYENPPACCEHCSAESDNLQRVFSVCTNFRLEGYGWFKDGYDGRDNKSYYQKRWWEK